MQPNLPLVLSLILYSISPIIPPELIPLISSQLCPSQPPTVFNIPPSFALDHLLSSSHRIRLALPAMPHTPTGVTEALQAAITSDLSPRYPHTDSKGIKHSPSHIIPSSTIIPRPSFTHTPASHGTLPTLHSNVSSVSLTLSLSISEPLATEFVYKPRYPPPLAQFQ
jgi:hypothetical protein